MNDKNNFDPTPTTGQPVNAMQATNIENEQISEIPNNQTTIEPQVSINQSNQVQTAPNQNIQPIDIQQQMQSIPTVEQDKQEFINNAQINSTVKKEEKKGGVNITFVIILFVVIFAAVLFLFPYLLNILG